MPLFFLKLKRGSDDLPNDPEPQKFPNLEAARIEAVEALLEISAQAVVCPPPDGIDITDTDGKILLRVSYQEALKAAH